MKQMVKVLTLQQPYAHYCIFGNSYVEFDKRVDPDIKDVENRNWYSAFRGRLYIQAGKTWYDGADTRNDVRDYYPEAFATMTAELGYIIGHVDMVDCVKGSPSPWFFGPYGFVFENATPLVAPIAIRGSLGIWNTRIEIEVA